MSILATVQSWKLDDFINEFKDSMLNKTCNIIQLKDLASKPNIITSSVSHSFLYHLSAFYLP